MTTIEAIIERAGDGTYDIFCRDEIFSGAGTSIDEAKKDLLKQMAFYKETARKEGFKYPAFLDDEYEIVYRIDAPSLMKYYVRGRCILTGRIGESHRNQSKATLGLSERNPAETQAVRPD